MTSDQTSKNVNKQNKQTKQTKQRDKTSSLLDFNSSKFTLGIRKQLHYKISRHAQGNNTHIA